MLTDKDKVVLDLHGAADAAFLARLDFVGRALVRAARCVQQDDVSEALMCLERLEYRVARVRAHGVNLEASVVGQLDRAQRIVAATAPALQGYAETARAAKAAATPAPEGGGRA